MGMERGNCVTVYWVMETDNGNCELDLVMGICILNMKWENCVTV